MAAGVAMRKYVTEFIGTFGLVFTVGTAILSGSSLAPLAIGAALMVLVYAGAHISGGQYNPAVTLGAFMRGRLPARDVVPYWLAQLLGAFIAAWLARFVISPAKVTELSGHGVGEMLLAEFIFTFALVYVYLNVMTSKVQPNNQFFGLAVGFTMMAGVFAVGGVSGGAFNPAIAFGGMLMGLFSWANIWVYLLAELAGAAVAALAFRYLNPDDAAGGPLESAPKMKMPKMPKITVTR
jgi:aquaporin Z